MAVQSVEEGEEDLDAEQQVLGMLSREENG